MKNYNQETFCGFIPTRNLVEMQKQKNPYKEKSKSKERKKDYTNERNRKRGNYE